ncbi:uncharacterized protein WCC33_017214 isoform 1-T3 [Rhinophrynus dorsalis]
MDLVAVDAARTEAEQRFDHSETAPGTDNFQVPKNGHTQRLRTPSGLSTSIMQSSDEDSTCRKRQRISNGPLSCPVPAQHLNAPKHEAHRSGECTVGAPSRSRDPGPGYLAQGEHCWAMRSGNRVTALYAELVRELEAQVAELHEILASRDDAAALREWKIQELEQENQALKRRVQNLEEQNDELSHRVQDATKEEECVLRPESHCIGKNSTPASSYVKTNHTHDSTQYSYRISGHGIGGAEPTASNMTGFLGTNCNAQLSASQTSSTPLPPTDSKVSIPEIIVSPILQPPAEPAPPNPAADVAGSSPEGMLRVSGVTSGFQYWMKMEDGGENTLPESCVMWEEPVQETLPDGTPAWASPIEGNGRPKLELVPASGVYITYQQLEDLSHIPPDKPKLMTRRLLDYFFSRETLARSSATGQRIAHNNTTMEKPLRLPDPVVTAIKAYVTRACGRGCNFNAVINSKCGTSRRAVKKMSIRIDWTEGAGKHCPRITPSSPALKGHCQQEKAPVPSMRGTTEPLLPQCVPQTS